MIDHSKLIDHKKEVSESGILLDLEFGHSFSMRDLTLKYIRTSQ